MNFEFENEFKNFKIDKKAKNIHLSLEDTKMLYSMFLKNRQQEWTQNPKVMDYFILFLRQYKSAVNIVKKLRQIENIECKFILVLSKEVIGEYTDNLSNALKFKFDNWFNTMIKGFCDKNRIK